MVIILIVMAAVWLICGVLAYGMTKAMCLEHYTWFPGKKHTRSTELKLWFLVIPLGIIALFNVSEKRRQWRFVGSKFFCWRMPKEFCEKRS